MKIYRPQIVQDLQTFYGDLLRDLESFPIIKDYLAALAKRMWEGIQSEHPAILSEINNYHPAYLGTPHAVLRQANLSLADAQTTIAHEYGFASWVNLKARANVPYDLAFEQAVNDLLAGNLSALQKLLSKRPNLIHQQSQYGHHATLLHYTASNGVEFWRQQVPANLPAITTYLLAQGADKEAQMQVYGGEFTSLPLLQSSAHPFAAGLGKEMAELLG